MLENSNRAKVRASPRTGRNAFAVGPPIEQAAIRQQMGSRTPRNSPDLRIVVGHLSKRRWGTSHTWSMALSLCSNVNLHSLASKLPKMSRADIEPAAQRRSPQDPPLRIPKRLWATDPMDRHQPMQRRDRVSPMKWRNTRRADDEHAGGIKKKELAKRASWLQICAYRPWLRPHPGANPRPARGG
ncbi:hypothetical protein C2845_PM04G09210 [Panicum miliaceum]|uniref:Uncharacterized protein n=1 Tax=Panicum miliaceum TaxID=4540 RepID=A0A3L6QMK4_PANMI|nr:hypothetical protein C2845_PM04G09210 [Panicum miliaceum]